MTEEDTMDYMAHEWCEGRFKVLKRERDEARRIAIELICSPHRHRIKMEIRSVAESWPEYPPFDPKGLLRP